MMGTGHKITGYDGDSKLDENVILLSAQERLNLEMLL
jgi:hypothetical protein